MKRSSRVASMALLAALVFALVGDRALTQSGTIQGIDPLEVLDLKVRPNVIVVLDSSGSMTNAVSETNTMSGDHPRSKMYLAKQVLKRVVSDNETKVSFLFGQYAQTSSLQTAARSAGADRAQYSTSNDADLGGFPSMSATQELAVVGDGGNRGFQSWQDIRPAWNRLRYRERISSSSSVTCDATLSVTAPGKFYRTGAALATDLQSAMMSAPCARTNTYTVTYSTTTGRFTFAKSGGRQYEIRWAESSIAGALAKNGDANTGFTDSNLLSDTPYTLLYRSNGTGSSGTGLNTRWEFTETNVDPDGAGPLPSRNVQLYQLRAGRIWNGEIVKVDAGGFICDMIYATPPLVVPPEVHVQQVAAGCGADTGPRVTFKWAGTDWGGNSLSCSGFSAKVPLIPCDLEAPPAPTQISTVNPYIDTELQFDAAGTPLSYTESLDGAWSVLTSPVNSLPAKAAGSTPIANSLIDIKGVFSNLWNNGQAGATVMAGPPPYQLVPIKNHTDPKEKTIVLFVTDGEDTCDTRSGTGQSQNWKALRVAHKAEQLYTRIAAAEPASSVITYMIGFGGAFGLGEPFRLNWPAWGGSGLGQPDVDLDVPLDGVIDQPDVPTTGTGEPQRWNPPCGTNDGTDDACINNYLKGLRARCRTCQDAIIAPDANSLAAVLQSIIDQGATDGEFSAQASITDSVFEYVDQSGAFSADDPATRFTGLTPIRFINSFKLPGFQGQLKAFQNVANVAVQKWSAGDKLQQSISSGMIAACPPNLANGNTLGRCTFLQLHANATDTSISTSTAAIKRRWFTTSQNGYFGVTAANLILKQAPYRLTLWPPDSFVNAGSLDTALGLSSMTLAQLQALPYGACAGTPLPVPCAVADARREAREMFLAFMAGADVVRGAAGGLPVRTTVAGSGGPVGSILYKARSWTLADSTLATAATIGPPPSGTPDATSFVDEYKIYRDGFRTDTFGNVNPDTTGDILKQGFGLRSPDANANGGNIPGAPEPVMTVVYSPANDGLHAFRAGPNCVPSSSACADRGGEELWAFVPFDQLGKLKERFRLEPQDRNKHVYMMARGIRFSDVFIPALDAAGIPAPITMFGKTLNGVWRKVMLVGRGAGGKYLTALDVTAPGPFTERALLATGPIPLWSRGNPDTTDGTLAGPKVNIRTDVAGLSDYDYYLKMGETWSIPAMGYVNKGANTTPRKTGGVDFVLYVGSGYGDPGQGTTFYTLDALTGDVVAAVDVEQVAATAPHGVPLTRTGLTYRNALVANPAAFVPEAYKPLTAPHPASSKTERVYIADLHGRLWKFLSDFPRVAIPAADLGFDQPVGIPVAILGLGDPVKSFVFVTSGLDRRANGPFKIYGFRDDGDRADTVTTGASTPALNGVVTFLPFAISTDPATTTPFAPRTFDQGPPGPAPCAGAPLPPALFRGTVQPAVALECSTDPLTPGECLFNGGAPKGRVFFGGTRLNLPNTQFAPPTPLKHCTGTYPCRSSFDSIVYFLGAQSGAAAYDVNASGDDAYRVFNDSRLVGLQTQADPGQGGGSRVNYDEGLMRGAPSPPPLGGIPPNSTTSNMSVVPAQVPGEPPPAVRFGSTVCQ